MKNDDDDNRTGSTKSTICMLLWSLMVFPKIFIRFLNLSSNYLQFLHTQRYLRREKPTEEIEVVYS